MRHRESGLPLVSRIPILRQNVKNIPVVVFSSLSFQELMDQSGLSVEEVADLSGKTPRTVYRWSRDEAKPPKLVKERLIDMIVQKMMPGASEAGPFSFIDLFAGIGGMRKGFESVGGHCVFTSEWDRFSQQTYKANFDCVNHPFKGDITKVKASDIPGHDLLVAGFPCQPFSLAGVSKKNALGRPHGFLDETQGTLFFDVARILDFHKPAAFLLENVKNLRGHDKGRTFDTIRRTLDELGYHYDWRIIDAKGYVPQHRERIFIAGFREDTGFSFDNLVVPDPAMGPRLGSILHPETGLEKPEGHFTEGNLAAVSDKYTLSDKLWQYLQGYAEKHRKKGNGFGFGLVGPGDVARTLSARYHKDGSEILIQRDGGNPRRLTPRECARLMGFDMPGGAEFKIPVSDTQAYRQFGNAVVVPVIEAIAAHMLPHINEVQKRLEGQLALEFPA